MTTNESTCYAQIDLNRVDNTETLSSPHTYAYNNCRNSTNSLKQAVRDGALFDHPHISNLSITSAMVGLSTRSFANLKRRTESNIATSPSLDSLQVKIEDLGDGEDTLKHTLSKALTADGYPFTTRRVERITFDVDFISPPIANLFRRVIMTEVPTLAIDRVLIHENDSVVLDELLSHRLGLLPIAGPVSLMEYITESSETSFQSLDAKRVLLFELEAEGTKNVSITPVYSGQLRWVPLPGQEAFQQCSNDSSIRGDDDNKQIFVVHPDILLTKLGPGQRVKLRAMAVKGIGAVHTKWSPVSTCYYEMKTSIELRENVTGKAAEKLVDICPKGVFGLVREPNKIGWEPEKTEAKGSTSKDSEQFSEDSTTVSAVVLDPSKCTISRECLRKDLYPEFENKLSIKKNKTSVRFHIESTGQLHPVEIFRTALTLFAERARYLAQIIHNTEVTNTFLD